MKTMTDFAAVRGWIHGRTNRMGWLSVLLILALGLTACSGDTSADESGAGESDGEARTSVTVGWSAGVTTLDYGKGIGSGDWRTLENVYDHLTFRNREGEAEPAIAESWEFNDDATAVTIHVRKGVLFHNGEELTAKDVAYSLERLEDPEFPGQAVASAEEVESVEVLDDYTVKVSFPEPNPFYMHNSSAFTPIVPASAEQIGYEEFGSSPETAIGTGPYKVVSWERDKELVLEAFDDYWRGEPSIKDVIIRPMPDDSARTAALLAGDVDLIAEVAIEQIPVVDEDPDLETRSITSVGRYFVQLNAHARAGGTPLESRDVREALAWGLDMQAIVDNIMDGHGELAHTGVLPFEIGYDDTIEPYGYDPERAREALERAGYGDGIDGLELLVRTADPKSAEIGAAIQGMWQEIGVDVELTVLENADFAERHLKDQMDMSMWLFSGAGTFHAGLALPYIYGCEDGSANWSRKFCNEDVYRLLMEEGPRLQATDEEAAMEVWHEAQQILHDEYASPGIFGLERTYGVNKDLNWEPHPYDSYWLYDASWSN